MFAHVTQHPVTPAHGTIVGLEQRRPSVVQGGASIGGASISAASLAMASIGAASLDGASIASASSMTGASLGASARQNPPRHRCGVGQDSSLVHGAPSPSRGE